MPIPCIQIVTLEKLKIDGERITNFIRLSWRRTQMKKHELTYNGELETIDNREETKISYVQARECSERELKKKLINTITV